MKTNKRSIFVQILSGIFSALLFLHIGYLLSEKLTLPKTDFFKYGELIISVAYVLVFMVFVALAAVLSKTYNRKYFYYSVFSVFFISISAALIAWYFEDTLLLYLFPFTINIGIPITAVARVIQRHTTYTIDWFDGYETYPLDETILYKIDVITIFLIIILVSVAIYQLHTETEEHEMVLNRWKLSFPARGFALGMIFGYGGYTTLITILNHLPYDGDNPVFEIMYYFISIISILLTISMVTFVLPVLLIPCLFISAIKEAKQQKNPRQFFNPLVLLATYLTCYGTYTIYETTMSCF